MEKKDTKKLFGKIPLKKVKNGYKIKLKLIHILPKELIDDIEDGAIDGKNLIKNIFIDAVNNEFEKL